MVSCIMMAVLQSMKEVVKSQEWVIIGNAMIDAIVNVIIVDIGYRIHRNIVNSMNNKVENI